MSAWVRSAGGSQARSMASSSAREASVVVVPPDRGGEERVLAEADLPLAAEEVVQAAGSVARLRGERDGGEGQAEQGDGASHRRGLLDRKGHGRPGSLARW